MADERTEFFRALLEQRMEVLMQMASASLHKLTTERELPPDSVDVAAEESNREFALHLRERERHLLVKIKRALQRLDDDEYGICIACGGDISHRRLLARPVATHCIDCKTEAEQLERGSRAF